MPRTRATVALLAVLVLASPLRAQLTFARERIDAGKVRAGLPLEQRFEFVNNGPETVHITTARASCGCAAPRLERRDYPPGARGAVSVSVHTLGQPEGPHRWRIHVGYRSGDKEHEAALELAAEIVTEVSVRPASLTLFAGQQLTHDIVITDRRAQPMRIKSVTASSPHLQTSLSEPRVEAAGRTWTVKLELSPDFPAGRHEETVTLATDDADYGDLRVRVTVVKRAPRDVSAHPGEVKFDATASGPIPARIVLVRTSDDARAVIIDDVVADHPAVSCKWARGPGSHATVKFTIDRARLEGNTLATTARIVLSGPVRETLDIPIRCEVSP